LILIFMTFMTFMTLKNQRNIKNKIHIRGETNVINVILTYRDLLAV
jgi:hypothetical protein